MFINCLFLFQYKCTCTTEMLKRRKQLRDNKFDLYNVFTVFQEKTKTEPVIEHSEEIKAISHTLLDYLGLKFLNILAKTFSPLPPYTHTQRRNLTRLCYPYSLRVFFPL